MVRVFLPLAGVLAACATATISSPGKSNDAIQADMNDCHVNVLSLHDPSSVKCLASHGDTIKYSGGSTAAPVSYTTNNRPTIIKMKNYPGASPEPSAPMTDQEASDPETRATIAQMREYFRLHVSNNSLSQGGKNDYDATVNDPQAENLRTKYAIAMGLAIRGNAPANDWLYDDRKFNDIRISCRWFQMTLDQIKSEFPGLWNMSVRDRQRIPD